ncbi:MAG: 50S ribosomal protein L6 [Rickettsiales bacterium]|nr:50S ribosomal protein L6 [Rickettsiales bacterium]
MVSRIGKLPIKVSGDIKVKIEDTIITISKGNQSRSYDFGTKVDVSFDGKEILVKENSDADTTRFCGLHRSNIFNIVKGLTEGYKVVLEYNGVGYKADVSKSFLVLNLGYSHDIVMKIPEGITVTPEKPNLINIQGVDKEKVGTFASRIISFRTTEPYKGKGIKYQGQWILRKEGKKK